MYVSIHIGKFLEMIQTNKVTDVSWTKKLYEQSFVFGIFKSRNIKISGRLDDRWQMTVGIL